MDFLGHTEGKRRSARRLYGGTGGDQRCGWREGWATLEVLVDEIGKDGVIAHEPGDAQKSMGWCTTRGGGAPGDRLTVEIVALMSMT